MVRVILFGLSSEHRILIRMTLETLWCTLVFMPPFGHWQFLYVFFSSFVCDFLSDIQCPSLGFVSTCNVEDMIAVVT